jgi:hypothetical protein
MQTLPSLVEEAQIDEQVQGAQQLLLQPLVQEEVQVAHVLEGAEEGAYYLLNCSHKDVDITRVIFLP